MLAKKYQTFEKGLLSHEVELALGHWLSLYTNAQEYDTIAPNPLPKISKYYTVFKQYLLSTHYKALPTGTVVPERFVREAIQNTRGASERTINKWKKIFVENKLIRSLGPNSWELIA
jgi:hypothetical protein